MDDTPTNSERALAAAPDGPTRDPFFNLFEESRGSNWSNFLWKKKKIIDELGPLIKTDADAFNRFEYATLPNLLNTIRPITSKVGFFLEPCTGRTRERGSSGHKWDEVEVGYRLSLLEVEMVKKGKEEHEAIIEPIEWQISKVGVPLGPQTADNYLGAITRGRRAALMNMFDIAPADKGVMKFFEKAEEEKIVADMLKELGKAKDEKGLTAWRDKYDSNFEAFSEESVNQLRAKYGDLLKEFKGE